MSDTSPAENAADRDLLFGVLALQAGFIDANQLLQVCSARSVDRATALADVLVQQGALTGADRAHVDGLVARTLQRNAGDVNATLAVAAGDQDRQTLSRAGDPAHQQTLFLPESAADAAAGDTFAAPPHGRDRYSLTRLHARGGIGQVWLARDERLGREVALKELLPGHARHEAIRARFLEEVKITGQLEHPSIVAVHDLGARAENGQPFYTMRFVRGQTLADAIRVYHRQRRAGQAGALELRALLGSFVMVCNAIAYAHSRGVLHRDLKPNNVVLGDYGETVVLDWGLAKRRGQAESVAGVAPAAETTAAGAAVTMQGQVLGTPGYMAPEQAEGHIDRIDERTDVYGLGGILYEILTDTVPITGTNTLDVIRRVSAEAPLLPRKHVAGTPPALEAVCLKALERAPERRYASAKELAADVTHWMADEPVSAWREPLLARAGRWVRKHRSAVATALAALSVAVLGLLAVAAVQRQSGRRLAEKNDELEQANFQLQVARDGLERSNERLAAARDRAERRVDLAVAAIENFRSTVDGNVAVKDRAENEALRKALLQAPLAFYQKLRDDLRGEAAGSPEARVKLADAFYQLGTLDREIGSQADALQAYEEAVGLLDPLFSQASGPQAAGLRDRLARVLDRRGSLQGDSKALTGVALESLRRARDLRQADVRDRPTAGTARVELAGTLNAIAFIEARQGNVDAALAGLHDSLGELEQARRLAPDDGAVGLQLARTYVQLSGVLLGRRSRLPEALAAAQAALDVSTALLRADPDNARYRVQQAGIYERLGEIHQAKGEGALALDAYGKQLRAAEGMSLAHPAQSEYKVNRILALSNVAAARGSLGDHTRELETLRQSEQLAEELVRDNPTNLRFKRTLGKQWTRMANPLHALGRVAEALAAVERSTAILEEIAKTDATDLTLLQGIAGSYYNAGIMNVELGRPDASLKAYDKALQMRERLARDHPDDPGMAHEVAATLGNVGVVQFQRARYTEARPAFRRAVDILEKLVAAHPDNMEYQNYLMRARQNLGSTLTQLGENGEALRVLRDGVAGSQRMAAAHPEVVLYRQDLANGLIVLGEAQRKAGQLDAAVASARQALDVREKLVKDHPEMPVNQFNFLGSVRVVAEFEQERGHAADALTGFRRVIDAINHTAKPPQELLVLLAVCHLKAAGLEKSAGAGVTAADARKELDEAMAVLRRAVAAGYQSLDELKEDPDYALLRGRDDFKALVREVEAKVRSSKGGG